MDAYERLLTDAVDGDAELFSRQDIVEASWRVVDPILDGATPVVDYEPGSWGPAEADELIEGDGGWHDPMPLGLIRKLLAVVRYRRSSRSESSQQFSRFENF